MHRIVDSRGVLAVRNLKESTPFYIEVLGFRRDFGDGSEGWSFLSRDNFKGVQPPHAGWTSNQVRRANTGQLTLSAWRLKLKIKF